MRAWWYHQTHLQYWVGYFDAPRWIVFFFLGWRWSVESVNSPASCFLGVTQYFRSNLTPLWDQASGPRAREVIAHGPQLLGCLLLAEDVAVYQKMTE